HLVEDLGDPGDFLIRGEIELSERALAQLAGRAMHDRRAPRLTKDPEELESLPPNPSKLPRLLDDQRPAHDRKGHEHEEDDLGDRPPVPDEREDATTQRVARHRRSFRLRSAYLRHYNHIRAACPRPPARPRRDQ